MSGDTTLKSIEMQPGIQTDITKYLAEGGFVDCNCMRWKNGRAEKVGGWQREAIAQVQSRNHRSNGFSSAFSSAFAKKGAAFSTAFSSADFSTQPIGDNVFTGVPRAMRTWSALDFSKYLLVGTSATLQVMNNDKVYDITPVVRQDIIDDNVTSVNDLVFITFDQDHGLVTGDYIEIVDDSEPFIINNFILEAGIYQVEAFGSTELGINIGHEIGFGVMPGSITVNLLLPVGRESNGSITGWSGGTWSTPGANGGGWSQPRTGGAGSAHLRDWSLDNWGEDGLACVREGGIYHWVKADGLETRAVILDDAPTQNLFILVAQPSRHLIAFGSQVFATGVFDPLIIRWASSETLDDWDASDPLNTAGEFRLPSGNYIVGAVQTRSEILIFTDTDVYSMRYVGDNDIFDFQPLGTNVSAISPHSFIDVNGIVYWMGIDKFYMYNGVIASVPCTISKFLFSQDGEGNYNFLQKEKTFAGLNKEFNEIWWFYPKEDETENSSYVKFNYAEGLWDFGTLQRTAWVDTGTYPKPFACDADGDLFEHEVGKNDDAAPMHSYVTTAYFDIDDGEQLIFLDRIVPDVFLPANKNIMITVYLKKYPHPEDDVLVKGPYFFNDSERKISLRGRARQMALKFEVTANNADYELGKIRVGFQIDGER